MSMFKNVNVVSINVEDYEMAKKWYGETLGWPVSFSSDEAGWHEFGVDHATHISLQRWSAEWGPVPRNGGATIVLGVEDAHATNAALAAKGVKVDDVVVIPNMVTYGTFYDPEGNKIQFASTPAA